jgi:hypothetical protein
MCTNVDVGNKRKKLRFDDDHVSYLPQGMLRKNRVQGGIKSTPTSLEPVIARADPIPSRVCAFLCAYCVDVTVSLEQPPREYNSLQTVLSESLVIHSRQSTGSGPPEDTSYQR